MDSKLVVYLKLLGLIRKKIEYIYKIDTLEAIDKLTYPYKNAEEFFRKRKKDILRGLILEKRKYDIEINPEDIELEYNQIYTLKKDKKIRTLFQEITYKENIIKLEDLIKQRMLNGSLKQLYVCDKIAEKNEKSYESIFKNYNIKMLEKSFTIEDIKKILLYLKRDYRFYLIIRFLLLKENNEKNKEEFLNQIIIMKNPENIETCEILKRYRTPYLED